ncbi:hypothetical protein [Variovorax guangxiensis]|uniref:hypothetical protein n=1 Tax=Variovorax guangxiensis TaxID=1775474 RepID=UPI002862C558|nr:hypothetical protein [Variovorax guangxiensis]MDR6855815.1 hypothetical protein [Variovorax guangxiensis]
MTTIRALRPRNALAGNEWASLVASLACARRVGLRHGMAEMGQPPIIFSVSHDQAARESVAYQADGTFDGAGFVGPLLQPFLVGGASARAIEPGKHEPHSKSRTRCGCSTHRVKGAD